MLSRSLKPIVNKQLREKFRDIADYTRNNAVIFDGELYAHDLTFQEITRYVMTQDFEDKKSIKKFGEVLKIPESLKFNCFDCIMKNGIEVPYNMRIKLAEGLLRFFSEVEIVKQAYVKNEADVKHRFEYALKEGYEGLILRSPEGKYKFGRTTIKEGNLFKVKPFRDF